MDDSRCELAANGDAGQVMRTETRHSIVLVIGTGVTAALSLVYAAVAGRILGPAENGVFATAVSLVLWGQLALGPINGTVARFSAKYIGEGYVGKIRTLVREVARRVGAYGLIGLAVALLLLKPLAGILQFQSVWPLVVALGMIYTTLLLSIARGVLRGTQSFRSYNVNIISEAAIRLAVGLVLLQLVWGATSGLTAYLIALVATLVLARTQLRRVWHGQAPEPLDGRAVRRFTVPMFIMMFTSAGFHNVDMLFVKHYFPAADAGIYGAVFVWARIMGTLVTPFNTLMLPLLTTLHTRRQALVGSFIRICAYFLLMAAIPLVLFALWPDRIITWSYGAPFSAAAPFLLTLAAARLVGYLAHMLALAGAATNNFRFLYVYLPAFAVQVAALSLWHESLGQVVTVVLVCEGITLVGMVVSFAVARRRSRRLTLTGNPA